MGSEESKPKEDVHPDLEPYVSKLSMEIENNKQNESDFKEPNSIKFVGEIKKSLGDGITSEISEQSCKNSNTADVDLVNKSNQYSSTKEDICLETDKKLEETALSKEELISDIKDECSLTQTLKQNIEEGTDFTTEIKSEKSHSLQIQSKYPGKEGKDIIKSTELHNNSNTLKSTGINIETNICSEADLMCRSKENLPLPGLTSDINSSENNTPQSSEINFDSRNEFDDIVKYSKCLPLEFPTDNALEYLSEVDLVLEKIQSSTISNVCVDNLSNLQNKTSYFKSKIEKIEYFKQQNLERGTSVKGSNIHTGEELQKLNHLLMEYKFLSVELNTVFYCTLCKIYINNDIRDNDYTGIKIHMESIVHNQRQNYLSNEFQFEDRINNTSVPSIIKELPTKYAQQRDYLKIEEQVLKCMLCEETLSFESTHIIDHFEKENHKCLYTKQIENDLQENCENVNGSEVDLTDINLDLSTETLLYICCVCDFVTKNFVIWRNHLKAECDNNVGKFLRSFVCTSCKMVLFGDKFTWEEHCLLKTHKPLSTDTNESILELNNLEEDRYTVLLPENFTKCKISKDDRNSIQEIFLSKIAKTCDEINNSSTRGFICFLCGTYLFYGPNKIEHRDSHVDAGTNIPFHHTKITCKSCSIDMYCDVYLRQRILKEHLSSPNHEIIAKIMGYDPNSPDLILMGKETDCSLSLETEFNIKNTEVTENINQFDNNTNKSGYEKCDINSKSTEVSDVNEAVESRTEINSRSKTHEKFLQQLMERYSKKKDISKNTEDIPRIGFYCQICNIYDFYGPNVKIHNIKHTVQNDINFNCKMFVCRTCNIELYGRKNLLQNHDKLPGHKQIELVVLQKSFGKTNESNCVTEISSLENPISNNEFGFENTTVKHQESVIYTTSEKDKGEQSEEIKIFPHSNNSIDNDEIHKNMLLHAAKTFFKFPILKLPLIIAYMCEICKESFEDERKWEIHINAKEHKNKGVFGDEHFCNICRSLFFCSDEYFNKHVQSFMHCAIKKHFNKNENGEGNHEENENVADVHSDDELDHKVAGKKKPIALIVQGYPTDTKIKNIYDIFQNIGLRVEHVSWNYKKKQDSALVFFSKHADIETVLESKEPLMIGENVLQITQFFPRKKGKSQNFHVSANLNKLFHSPAVFMGVVDRIIIRYCRIANQESLKTQHALDDIKKALNDTYVHPFGSRMYGTASGTSDLDVFVEIDGSYFDASIEENARREHKVMRSIADYIRKYNRFKKCVVFSNILFIPARVPIVRLIHQPTNLACDLSCKNGLSVENTILTKCYLDSNPRVAWLVTAVKYWANINSLKDSSKFTSYALTWMVLYFLMQLKEPVVFPVETLRLLPHSDKLSITGWNCQFCSDVNLYPKTKNTQLVLELLHDFFVFYATLDHENSVLCPIIGSTVSKKHFRKLNLPKCFQSYIDRFNVTSEHILLKKPLCLQDPFDLGHNLTKNVTEDCLIYFKHLCIKSARMCEQW